MTRLDADGLPLPDPDFAAHRRAEAAAFFTGESEIEPVLHATDPGTWRDLSARIPGLLVTSAGGACPFQSEGTLHGLAYYFRYRHGQATLAVGGDPIGAPLYSAALTYGDDYDGILDRSQFSDLMARLVPALTRARFQWQFTGFEVEITERPDGTLTFSTTDTAQTYWAWGRTPAEAHARLHEPSAALTERNPRWTLGIQREAARARRIDPTPVNTDDRTYPDPEPVFTAR